MEKLVKVLVDVPEVNGGFANYQVVDYRENSNGTVVLEIHVQPEDKTWMFAYTAEGVLGLEHIRAMRDMFSIMTLEYPWIDA